MKKLITLIPVLSILGLMLVSCSSEPATTTTTTPQTTVTTHPPPTGNAPAMPPVGYQYH